MYPVLSLHNIMNILDLSDTFQVLHYSVYLSNIKFQKFVCRRRTKILCSSLKATRTRRTLRRTKPRGDLRSLRLISSRNRLCRTNNKYAAHRCWSWNYMVLRTGYYKSFCLQVTLPSHPPLPPPPVLNNTMVVPPLSNSSKPHPSSAEQEVAPSDAKLISILTAFLIVHPLGASLDYLVSYVRSMTPDVTQATINQVLQKFPEIFRKKTSGVGASMDHRWEFVTFDNIKNDSWPLTRQISRYSFPLIGLLNRQR